MIKADRIRSAKLLIFGLWSRRHIRTQSLSVMYLHEYFLLINISWLDLIKLFHSSFILSRVLQSLWACVRFPSLKRSLWTSTSSSRASSTRGCWMPTISCRSPLLLWWPKLVRVDRARPWGTASKICRPSLSSKPLSRSPREYSVKDTSSPQRENLGDVCRSLSGIGFMKLQSCNLWTFAEDTNANSSVIIKRKNTESSWTVCVHMWLVQVYWGICWISFNLCSILHICLPCPVQWSGPGGRTSGGESPCVRPGCVWTVPAPPHWHLSGHCHQPHQGLPGPDLASWVKKTNWSKPAMMPVWGRSKQWL